MKKVMFTAALMVCSVLFVFAQESNINKTDAKGLKQGAWEEKIATGISSGQYIDDQKNGNWISHATNGNLTRIESYSKGIRDGIFVEIDQRGYLVSEMYYVNNLLEGTAKKFFYGTNPASVIDYKQGKMNGKKKDYYENAAGKLKEESNYINDIKEGSSVFYAVNGDPIAEYNYKNGSLEGIQKTYYAGKKLMSEQNYINNTESGLYKEYFESGKVKIETTYKNGAMDGKYVEFDEEGKMKVEGIYVNGEKEGKWTEFDANGKPSKVSKFVKGVEK
ncbi:MAG: toxin-antitoxin system YwqK family antitoxin [Bacteroidales bacterium]|nr:toxin-antitoxin system YwqK family antitoxin [Bacteroidales bacterium]